MSENGDSDRGYKAGNVASLVNRLSKELTNKTPPEIHNRKAAHDIRTRRAQVVYSYTPEHEDELRLNIQDVVEILGEEEEGWFKGKLNGKVGVFPSNFVKEVESSANKSDDEKSQPARVPSVKSDDGHPPAEIQIAPKKPTGGMGFGNIFSQNQKIDLKPVNDSRKFAPPPAAAATTNTVVPPLHPVHPPAPTKVDVTPLPAPILDEFARAAFSYDPENEDELKLDVGDIVLIISKECEDPGWWMGKVGHGGKKGVFPDNFVKIIPHSEVPQHLLSASKVSPNNSVPAPPTKPVKPKLAAPPVPLPASTGRADIPEGTKEPAAMTTVSSAGPPSVNNARRNFFNNSADPVSGSGKPTVHGSKASNEVTNVAGRPSSPATADTSKKPDDVTSSGSGKGSVLLAGRNALGSLRFPVGGGAGPLPRKPQSSSDLRASPSDDSTGGVAPVVSNEINLRSTTNADNGNGGGSVSTNTESTGSTTTDKLSHLTTSRPKNPNRRPPSQVFLHGSNIAIAESTTIDEAPTLPPPTATPAAAASPITTTNNLMSHTESVPASRSFERTEGVILPPSVSSSTTHHHHTPTTTIQLDNSNNKMTTNAATREEYERLKRELEMFKMETNRKIESMDRKLHELSQKL